MHDKRKIVGFSSVSIVLISVYLYTIAPTVSLWDCGEFITCAHILGVPHPPGTPFFILLGRIFDIVIPFGEVAKRINFLSSLSSAIAGGFLYLIILSVFQRFRENRGKRLDLNCHLIAVFSATCAGLSFSIWDTSVETEVYATSILILVIGLWIALLWYKNREMRGNDNYFLLLIYLIFLAFGIHLLPLLLIPGTLVFVIMADRKIFNNPKLIIFSLILILIGITTYYYLMVRACSNPAINEADPDTFRKLWEVIRRKQYGSEGILGLFYRHTSWQTNYGFFRGLFEQLKVFFKYFSWQFFPYPRANTGVLLRYVSLFGTYIYVLIGVWGMWVHFKQDKESFWLFFILFILLTFGLVFYLNHEFSPSDPNPAHQPREPRERDYFWSPAFFLFLFYVAIGLYWIYVKLKKINISYGYAGILLAFLIGFAPLISNIKSHANRRENWIASDYAYNLLITPVDHSILFTYGDNDTFPVWFLQEVKNVRKFDPKNKKGVQVANFSLMNTAWYIRQLKAAGIPMDFASPFKGTNIESKYLRDKRSGKTNLNFEEWVINNIQPMRCEDEEWIRPADIVVRNTILCAIGKKPSFKDFIMPSDTFVKKYIKKDFNPSINIYFSFPVESYSKEVFGPYIELEGFAYRLVGKKRRGMINYKKTFDKLIREFKTSYCDNPTIYTGRAQTKPLINHAYISLAFSDLALRKFTWENRKTISESKKDTLRMLETILNRAFIFSMKSKFALSTTSDAANGFKKIYSLLGEEKRATNFCDSLLSIIDIPSLHLLRAEMLILKAKSKKENKEELKKATEEFLFLLDKEEFRPLAYRGLIELYSISNESGKIKEIISEIRNDPKLLDQVILLSIRFSPKGAIKLLEIWKEIYPSEAAKVDPVINEIKKRHKGIL